MQADRYLVGINLNLQYRLGEKRHILVRTAAARHANEISDYIQPTLNLLAPEFIYGISVGYAYLSFLGPIEAHLGYSTLSPKLNLYINIGHSF